MEVPASLVPDIVWGVILVGLVISSNVGIDGAVKSTVKVTEEVPEFPSGVSVGLIVTVYVPIPNGWSGIKRKRLEFICH